MWGWTGGKRLMNRAHAMLLLGLLISSLASQANAQERVDEARRLTELGRMAEARTLLRAELDEAPAPATAFNLALVEHSVGDFEAAEALFARLLANEFGEMPPERRQRAGELMAASVAEMGTIVLRWDAPQPATIRVDGRPKGRIVRGETLRIRVNPGQHVVNAQSEGMEMVRELDVARASASSLTLGGVSAEGDGQSGNGLLESGGIDGEDAPPRRKWPWAVAIGALLIGGVVVGAVLLTRDPATPSVPDGYVGLVEF